MELLNVYIIMEAKQLIQLDQHHKQSILILLFLFQLMLLHDLIQI